MPFSLASNREKTYCKGKNKAGEDCGIYWGLDSEGFCQHHYHICRGFKPNDQPCGSYQKRDGSGYCSFRHNPLLNGDITKPILFRLDDLRKNKGDVILEYRDNKDIHTGDEIKDLSDFHLDHLTECQMFSCGVDSITKTGTSFSQMKSNLIGFCREYIVSTDDNLGFTESQLNIHKAKGITGYIEDLKSGKKTSELVKYLIKSDIDRRTSGTIRKNLYKSTHHCIGLLEYEQPLHSEMMEQLQNDIVNLKLKE
jgi:hypothetical protein